MPALKGQRFWSDEDVKAVVVQWFQQQLISSCINGMLASMPKGNIFNGHYSFTQNNSQTDFI
jgi:hypothetical protein